MKKSDVRKKIVRCNSLIFFAERRVLSLQRSKELCCSKFEQFGVEYDNQINCVQNQINKLKKFYEIYSYQIKMFKTCYVVDGIITPFKSFAELKDNNFPLVETVEAFIEDEGDIDVDLETGSLEYYWWANGKEESHKFPIEIKFEEIECHDGEGQSTGESYYDWYEIHIGNCIFGQGDLTSFFGEIGGRSIEFYAEIQTQQENEY